MVHEGGQVGRRIQKGSFFLFSFNNNEVNEVK